VNLPPSVQRLATVDYCDGLGIAVGSHTVSFVHSTKRFFQVGLKTTRTVPLPDTAADQLPAIRRALTDFLADIETLPDQTVLCLPRTAASVSRLVVPETARGSLEQVVRYEVERLLPFREEEIYYDYVTTEEGGEERRLGLVIFCLPRQTVDPLVSLLVEHELRPQSVTLSSAAHATTLLACCPAEHGQRVLAAQENGSLELNFLHERQLVASHTVPVSRVAAADTWTETLARGIARNFPGSAPDAIPVFTWNGHGSLPVSVEPERDLAHAARERFAVVAADGALPVETCSAIGASLQAVGEGEAVNVLPAASRAHREKLLSPLTLVFAGGILVLSLVWAASMLIQDRRALNHVQDQIQALAPAVRQVQDDEAVVQRLQAQLQTLRAETRIRLTPLLKDMSERIPQQIYLTALQFKNGKVELTGVARSGSASDLVGALEASPCLRDVAPKAPFKTTGKGETFTLAAQVHPCD
jgi:Tfp pilus assembly protein PilN